jgi:hypothetical protein
MRETGTRSWFVMESTDKDKEILQKWHKNVGKNVEVRQVEDEQHDEGLDLLDEYDQSIDEEEGIPDDD